MMAGGAFASATVEEFVIKSAAAQSACSVYKELLELDEKDFSDD